MKNILDSIQGVSLPCSRLWRKAAALDGIPSAHAPSGTARCARLTQRGAAGRLRLLRATAALLAAGILFSQHLAAEETVHVLMETSMGPIELQLYPEKAPATVANFVEYANSGFYDGTIFHRVISSFMIQGGGFTPDMQKKTTREPIANEANNGLSNKRGTIAMARLPQPHSATAQFFINVQNNMNLDYQGQSNWGYAVFGTVTHGMNVVDDIRFVKTKSERPFSDVPVEPVIIEKVTILKR